MRIAQTKVLIPIFLLISINALAQQQIRLSDKLQKQKIKAVNRKITVYGERQEAVEMNAEKSDGLGILQGITFNTGTIEVELLGENNPGNSFLGIAFNIQNDTTYEAIYFRPFNFVANEQIRKDHMVQYIFHPEFTWHKLREERTGEFEHEIIPPPNPDDWFKATLKITEDQVKVFVNNKPEPALTVNRLTSPASKKIGIWTGYNSSGRFRNLILKKE